MPHLVCPRSHHPQRIGGISCRAHCHRWCTLKNYHVNNKYKMELINYPTPCRERRAANNGDTDVAAIGVVRLERGCSLSREDQGRRCHRLERSQSLSREDLGGRSPSPVMAAARHFPSPLPSPSPSPPPWLSLVCRLVVMSTPPPLVLSTAKVNVQGNDDPMNYAGILSSQFKTVCATSSS